MKGVREVLESKILTYEQKVLALARLAEDSVHPLRMSDELKETMEKGIICDLNEGHAPYRPRYIVPDYPLFMAQGSAFLELSPPKTLDEALNNLLILYKHVPSITSFPVYIGNLDTLLEPFMSDESKDYESLKRFFIHIDRTITDSFCHGNVGPKATKAGQLILRVQRELETSIPNLTMKVNGDTPDSFVIDGINTALKTAKPSFANDEIFAPEFTGDYGIVSCYNGLPIGGGSYTLIRMNLAKLAQTTKNKKEFLDQALPMAAKLIIGYIDERIRYLVEESNFFESSFLVREHLINKDKFTAMLGVIGLAEAVNHFYDDGTLESHFGYNAEADDFGETIIETLDQLVKEHQSVYCLGTNQKILLHAQVGIDTDEGASPGCRIPIGEEPPMGTHLKQSARFHKYFPSGIGDVFRFDETVERNPEYMLDIIKGGFELGMRYFSAYGENADVVRITGYLVKRSEIEKLRQDQQVLRDTVALGMGADDNQHVLSRKLRK
ncbi:MAG: YjjI family glycine radical enzyme [Clostridia bacterium]|nr:YjjI family glycine radical enzyme [Clostridia bacterium]